MNMLFEAQAVDIFILSIGALAMGIIILVRSSNIAIDSAIYLAKHFSISPLLIGFTVLAFGTSLPELIVSLNAHLHGNTGIAIGNILGSNIANILLVLGVAALFTTLRATPQLIIRDLVMMIVATLALMGLLYTGGVSRLSGSCMLLVLLAYTISQYIRASKENAPVKDIDSPLFKSVFTAGFGLVVALTGIAIGAEFLVRGASTSAQILGVPDVVIGLSIIAIGTSLPELATCVVAARKKQTELIFGNIIGSNVFNILFILGTTAAVKPVLSDNLASQVLDMDIWIVLGISLLFTALLLTFKKIGKLTGLVFLTAYAIYIVTIYAIYLI